MKSLSLSNFVSVSLSLSLHNALALPHPFHSAVSSNPFNPLIARNDFGFTPEDIHASNGGGENPLAGGYSKKLQGDKPTEDNGDGKSVDGSGNGKGDVQSGGSGGSGRVTVANGVTKVDLGDGAEATINKATDTTEVDVTKVCKPRKRRRWSQMFARWGDSGSPCFTAAQFPQVAKYNDAFKATQAQADKFYQAQMDWTNSEVERAFHGVDHANVRSLGPGVQPDSGTILSADFTRAQLLPVLDSPKIPEPGSAEPGTALSPNTNLLGRLTPKAAFSLYLRQIQDAKGLPGSEYENVVAIQRKWIKYLNIDPEGYLRQKTGATGPESPMLQRAQVPRVQDLTNPIFHFSGDSQNVFEANLPPRNSLAHPDINLGGKGLRPKLGEDFVNEYRALGQHVETLTTWGKRAMRQLEKAGGLAPGSLDSLLQEIEDAVTDPANAGKTLKFTRNGYVIKAVGNKIIIQSQPLSTGAKVAMGVSIVPVAGAVGYQIVWDKNR